MPSKYQPKSNVGTCWTVELVTVKPGKGGTLRGMTIESTGTVLFRGETWHEAQRWLNAWRETAGPGQRGSVYQRSGVAPSTGA